MSYGGYSYLDFKHKPDKESDFTVLFWAKADAPIEKAAEAIAAESSVGSWTKIRTMNDFVWNHYRARVFWIGKVGNNAGFIKIAYPIEHFDTKNALQFQTSVLGNIFGLKELRELYVWDISFPKKYQKRFTGPYAGLHGIRKMAGTERSGRPHIGTIVKPKVGLAPKEWARVAYEAYCGGLDLVKDDENLVDQEFCRWKERLKEVVKSIEHAARETGQSHLYSSNITDRYSRMVERVDYLNDMGLQKHIIVMLDTYIMGPGALQEILALTKKYKFATHGHRAGFAAANRGNFGVNFQIYEKFYRLMGIDQMHIGTGVGKMEGSPAAIRNLHDIAEKRQLEGKFYLGSLPMEFADHIKPMLSIASGGLDAGKVDALIALHGMNTSIQAGAGVHGHPGGTRAGAKSLRQAVDAVMKGISSQDYKQSHRELAEAIAKWGYFSPEKVRRALEYERRSAKKLTKTALEKGREGMSLAVE